MWIINSIYVNSEYWEHDYTTVDQQYCTREHERTIVDHLFYIWEHDLTSVNHQYCIWERNWCKHDHTTVGHQFCICEHWEHDITVDHQFCKCMRVIYKRERRRENFLPCTLLTVISLTKTIPLLLSLIKVANRVSHKSCKSWKASCRGKMFKIGHCRGSLAINFEKRNPKIGQLTVMC